MIEFRAASALEPRRAPDLRDWSRPLELLLASQTQLREAHLDLLRGNLGAMQAHAPDNGVLRDPRPFVVASGWAAAAAVLEDGRRQLVSLFLPGDVVDPAVDLRDELMVVALTSLRTLDARELIETMAAPLPPEFAGLAGAWARLRAAAQVRLTRHIVRLGRLSAYERTADLLLDLHRRMRQAGQADGQGMPLPLTQEVLADHLGLSVVHMNRTLQQLRKDGLILRRSGRVLFPAPQRMAQVARRIGPD